LGGEEEEAKVGALEAGAKEKVAGREEVAGKAEGATG